MPELLTDGWEDYWTELVGTLGWLDTPLPFWIYWSYPALTLLVAMSSNSSARTLQMSSRMFLFAVLFLCVVLVESAIFITWVQPGKLVVDGIQGRYFLPLVLPFFLLLSNNRFTVSAESKWPAAVVCSYCTAVLLTTCVTIVERYYW